ncbi:hypothetical protein COLO4_36547 [Corchorus olitorius]|uniref:Uncharacterized protein n=1 Tax=Corchorus olitorius TaxID=93759 RepID=A0A1R3G880_9ROSI|nr:hypothetical protein COLO4_36547 [Corchorus olitorius]
MALRQRQTPPTQFNIKKSTFSRVMYVDNAYYSLFTQRISFPTSNEFT